MEPKENKFITECTHCRGFGCDYCEDITLRQTDEDRKKIEESLVFCDDDIVNGEES